MELKIIDRIIIYFGLLPKTGKVQDMLMNRQIKEIIKITPEEEALGVVLNKDDRGNVSIKHLSVEAHNVVTTMNFTDEEVEHLKKAAIQADSESTVSEYNLDTIMKIINYKKS